MVRFLMAFSSQMMSRIITSTEVLPENCLSPVPICVHFHGSGQNSGTQRPVQEEHSSGISLLLFGFADC